MCYRSLLLDLTLMHILFNVDVKTSQKYQESWTFTPHASWFIRVKLKYMSVKFKKEKKKTVNTIIIRIIHQFFHHRSEMKFHAIFNMQRVNKFKWGTINTECLLLYFLFLPFFLIFYERRADLTRNKIEGETISFLEWNKVQIT